MLSKIDEQLPFSRHVVCIFKQINLVQYAMFVALMGMKEVIVGNPKRDIVVCPRFVIVTTGYPVGLFERTVETFYKLLVRTKFFRYFIIGQSENLCNTEMKILAEFLKNCMAART